MTVQAINLYPLGMPAAGLIAGQDRKARLTWSLKFLAATYQSKPNKPILYPGILVIQLAGLEKRRLHDYFQLPLSFILSKADVYARRYSGGEKPIILDIGGGSSSTHRAFAEEKGMISICIDPAVAVLAKLAELFNMEQIAEGVWKDRRLEHYFVVGDAETAAEVFGIDHQHPLLRSQLAWKKDLQRRLIGIGQAFDPLEMPDKLFPTCLKKITESDRRLRNFDAADDRTEQVNKLKERYRSPSLSEQKARDYLVREAQAERRSLVEAKWEYYQEKNDRDIKRLIRQLRNQDALLARTRREVLPLIDPPPLIDVAFNAFQNYRTDVSASMSGILAKVLLYVEGHGTTGVNTDSDLMNYESVLSGAYALSYQTDANYREEGRDSYPVRDLAGPNHNYLTTHAREDLLPF